MMDKPETPVRLLLVDDEVDFLDAGSRALSRRGFDVSRAPDAFGAMELLAKRVFDVAILDIKMPGMDGVELFKVIRERWSATAVIMLTGHGTVQEAFTTSRDGVFDYLAKPCDFDDLAVICHRAARRDLGDEGEDPREERDPISVLVVDDEPGLLATMQKVLSRRNMKVTTAAGGVEALEEIEQCPPSVVLLDVRMPGMHGLEVLRRIKESHREIEVILHTGHPELSLAVQGMREGAFDFIEKPHDIDKLASRIRAAARASCSSVEELRNAQVEEILRGRTD